MTKAPKAAAPHGALPSELPSVRVRALQPKRRRAGLDFTAEPRDLTPEDFGGGLSGAIAFGAVLADPLLKVTVLEPGAKDEPPIEREITVEERDAFAAMLEAEQARVDPDLPPNGAAAGE